MTIMVPTASKQSMTQFQLGVSTPGNQIMKLFTNNITPGLADVAATYTEMATLGYVAKTLTKTSWTATNANPSVATYAQQTWTFTAGTAVTVYGYFVVDATSGLLLWSETFAAPRVVQNTGDTIIITPTITLT